MIGIFGGGDDKVDKTCFALVRPQKLFKEFFSKRMRELGLRNSTFCLVFSGGITR